MKCIYRLDKASPKQNNLCSYSLTVQFLKEYNFICYILNLKYLQISSSDVFIPSLWHYTEVAETIVGKPNVCPKRDTRLQSP